MCKKGINSIFWSYSEKISFGEHVSGNISSRKDSSRLKEMIVVYSVIFESSTLIVSCYDRKN